MDICGYVTPELKTHHSLAIYLYLTPVIKLLLSSPYQGKYATTSMGEPPFSSPEKGKPGWVY